MPTVNLFGVNNSNQDIYILVSWKKSLVVRMPCLFESMEKDLIICKNLGLS